MDALERRFVVLRGIEQPVAAATGVGFPEPHPFRPDSQYQADSPCRAAVPQAGVLECGLNAPECGLLEPWQGVKLTTVPGPTGRERQASSAAIRLG